MGLAAFGPILFDFQRWVSEEARAQRVDHLFFVGREGHLLLDLYEKSSQLGAVPASYFQSSRRALYGALPKTEETLSRILSDGAFRGLMKELLEARLGVSDGDQEMVIELPDDHDLVLETLIPMGDALNARAEEERLGLLSYFEEAGLHDHARPGIVGLGFEASLQGLLEELGGVSLLGIYMFGEHGVLRQEHRYESNQEDFPYGEYLQAFFQPTKGEVERFEKGTPIFGPPGKPHEDIEKRQVIQEGVLDYFRSIAQLGISDPFDGSYLTALDVYEAVMASEMYDELLGELWFEDRFDNIGPVKMSDRNTIL